MLRGYKFGFLPIDDDTPQLVPPRRWILNADGKEFKHES